jgi:hypothetical protein
VKSSPSDREFRLYSAGFATLGVVLMVDQYFQGPFGTGMRRYAGYGGGAVALLLALLFLAVTVPVPRSRRRPGSGMGRH